MEDNIRDYATGAFRRYSAMGMPDYKTLSESVKDISDVPKLMDVYAVEKTLESFEQVKPIINEAVKSVYFTSPDRPFTRTEAARRLRYFALNNNVSERNAYRFLRQARTEFALHRGLSI